MSEKQTIDYRYFYWGPLLMNFKVPKEVLKGLITRGRKSKIDARRDLAGHIDNEKNFSDNDLKWFVSKMDVQFSTYFNMWKDTTRVDYNEIFKDCGLALKSLWINFMKPGEYNPPHVHDHDFSFVIYCKNPPKLKEEQEKNIAMSEAPGGVIFQYGEMEKWQLNTYSFRPVEGDMFIFPARLRHYVIPYRSKGERISVSGNLYIHNLKSNQRQYIGI